MARFDAAMMHNTFYVVRRFDLARSDPFIIGYSRHWIRCPDCAVRVAVNEKLVREACRRVIKWQSQYQKSIRRGFGNEDRSRRLDLDLKYLLPKILPGIQPHPPIRCSVCCDGCPVARFAWEIFPQDVRFIKRFKGFTVDRLRKHTALCL